MIIRLFNPETRTYSRLEMDTSEAYQRMADAITRGTAELLEIAAGLKHIVAKIEWVDGDFAVKFVPKSATMQATGLIDELRRVAITQDDKARQEALRQAVTFALDPVLNTIEGENQ